MDNFFSQKKHQFFCFFLLQFSENLIFTNWKACSATNYQTILPLMADVILHLKDGKHKHNSLCDKTNDVLIAEGIEESHNGKIRTTSKTPFTFAMLLWIYPAPVYVNTTVNII